MSNKQNIVTFSSSDELISLVVRLDPHIETVWLNLNQIAELLGRDKSVISRHLKRIFETEELDKNSVIRNYRITANDGKTMMFYTITLI